MTDITTTTPNQEQQLKEAANTNCLEGIRCPECGQADRFFIIGGAQFDVTDEGSETMGDHEWGDESPARCPECGHDGRLRDFRESPPDAEVMKQQVEVTLKLSLWLDATLDEDDIVTHVRASLPHAFGEELTAMQNPVDIIAVEEEAEIYGNEVPPVEVLPPDADGQNNDRAAWARHALTAFRRLTGTDREAALCDLLSDLMHLCDRDPRLGDFESQLERAREHYLAETAGEVA